MAKGGCLSHNEPAFPGSRVGAGLASLQSKYQGLHHSCGLRCWREEQKPPFPSFSGRTSHSHKHQPLILPPGVQCTLQIEHKFTWATSQQERRLIRTLNQNSAQDAECKKTINTEFFPTAHHQANRSLEHHSREAGGSSEPPESNKFKDSGSWQKKGF